MVSLFEDGKNIRTNGTTIFFDCNKSLERRGLTPRKGLFLKSYSQYVNHYQQVVTLLADRKQDKQFQVFLIELKNQSTGKGIQDYMIMPVQRIPRYAMLLGVCCFPIQICYTFFFSKEDKQHWNFDH